MKETIAAILRLRKNPDKGDEVFRCGYNGAIDAVVAILAATPAPATADALTDAARDVLAERRRQIEQEGWTPEHDDEHRGGQMPMAAASYAVAASYAAAGLYPMPKGKPPTSWPWDKSWWKPGKARRMLIKAGALILAEIERLDRAATTPATATADAPKRETTEISLYYMRDDHTFKRLKGSVEEMLVQCMEEYDAGFTAGMLCTKSIPGFRNVHAGTDRKHFKNSAHTWLARAMSWSDKS